MREDTEALLLGRGASKMCLGDHFWLPKVAWGDQFWLPKVVRGTTLGGEHFWHDRTLAYQISSSGMLVGVVT